MRQMRPCWRSSRSTSPRRDPCRCSQADVCRRFSSRGRVCRKRSYYLSFLGSRLGEVLLLFCHRVLIVNINPMQFCKRLLSANNVKKSFSGIAVKVVGAFASARRRRRRLPEQEMRPCWRSSRSTSPRRDPCRCSQADVCRRFSSRGRVCRKRSYYVRFLGSRLGEVLFLPFLLGRICRKRSYSFPP